jgi:hypothetical protein
LREGRVSGHAQAMNLSWIARALLASSLLVATGCGGGASLCDDICDCTGECSENDREECYDEVDDEQRAADNEDCGSQYDEYLSCLNSEFECREGGRYDLDGCSFERDEVRDCLDDGNRGNGPDF